MDFVRLTSNFKSRVAIGVPVHIGLSRFIPFQVLAYNKFRLQGCTLLQSEKKCTLSENFSNGKGESLSDSNVINEFTPFASLVIQ